MTSINYIHWSNDLKTQNLLTAFLQVYFTLNFQSRFLLQLMYSNPLLFIVNKTFNGAFWYLTNCWQSCTIIINTCFS